MNILLLLIFAVTLAIFCSILLAFYIAYRGFRMFRSFIEPQGEGKPSQAGEVAQALADMVARSAIAQAKATFMGKASGESRAGQAAMADLMQDEANNTNPLIGGLLSSFPSARKWLAKNPMALEYALSKLGGLGKGQSTGNGSRPSDSPVKFKL